MLARIILFLISLLLAPALGLYASIKVMPDMTWLREASFIVLGFSLALPTFFFLSTLILARDRSWLARLFPPLVRIVLGTLPLILMADAVLVAIATWEFAEAGVIENLKILAALGMFGLLLLVSGIGIFTDMRELLEPDPLRVTGVVLERDEMPDLFARVARLAKRLGSREPERIVIGIEPNAFVTNHPLRLRGVGDLSGAETLYLSTVVLRFLDDAELDAVIGHELGHFRGKDLEFSGRFIPVFRRLSIARRSVNHESDDDDASSWIAMPAVGFLSLMCYSTGLIVGGIQRDREFAADQASLEVSTPSAAVSALVKFSAISFRWDSFHRAVSEVLRRGVARRNTSRDYLVHTRQFLASVKPELLRRGLIEARIPHPLDSHPTPVQRAVAMGVNHAAVVDASLAALQIDRPVAIALDAIEERITQIDGEFYRHPSYPVVISDETELPPEMSYGRPKSSTSA